MMTHVRENPELLKHTTKMENIGPNEKKKRGVLIMIKGVPRTFTRR
jgi:hypothetical protein